MNNLVQFNNIDVEIINKDNDKYISGAQIGRALELSQADAVAKIYNRHKEEFNTDMTQLIRRGSRTLRVFNRDGAWLIGMFARTQRAADFRKWVIKVLSAVADGQLQPVSAQYAPVDMKAIGGMVKKCCKAAIREEIADWHLKSYKPEFSRREDGDFTINKECAIFDGVTAMYGVEKLCRLVSSIEKEQKVRSVEEETLKNTLNWVRDKLNETVSVLDSDKKIVPVADLPKSKK